jgi:hypothetical protein
MRKILIIFVFAFLFLYSTKNSNAQEIPLPEPGTTIVCNSCAAPQSTLPGANFSVELSQCNLCEVGVDENQNEVFSNCIPFDNYPIEIQAFNESTNSYADLGVGYGYIQNQSVNFSISIPTEGVWGIFYADAQTGGQRTPRFCSNVTISQQENPPPPPEGPISTLICGTQTQGYSPLCDLSCPSQYTGIGNTYECRRYNANYMCALPEGPGIDTAIGCIPFAKPEMIAGFLVKWSIRIAGGIAILVFIAAGFQYITSSGDPEKIDSAKGLLTSAITGLLLIIFSVFLLRFIGYNILEIFR